MRPGSILAALLMGAGGVALAGPHAAAADVRDGHCDSGTGVTLVVDFQELGADTIVKCVENVAPGTTGLQVLQEAGLNPAGTIHDGLGFVCRINDLPSRTEALVVDGRPDYREACRQTPPKNAFWSYWHADDGGAWTFTQLGAGNHAAIIGGYEGWSFSLNRTDDSNPPPGVEPSRPAAAPDSTSAQTPATRAEPAEATPVEPPVGTIMGAGAVAALGAGGGIMWWRRRSL